MQFHTDDFVRELSGGRFAFLRDGPGIVGKLLQSGIALRLNVIVCSCNRQQKYAGYCSGENAENWLVSLAHGNLFLLAEGVLESSVANLTLTPGFFGSMRRLPAFQ